MHIVSKTVSGGFNPVQRAKETLKPALQSQVSTSSQKSQSTELSILKGPSMQALLKNLASQNLDAAELRTQFIQAVLKDTLSSVVSKERLEEMAQDIDSLLELDPTLGHEMSRHLRNIGNI